MKTHKTMRALAAATFAALTLAACGGGSEPAGSEQVSMLKRGAGGTTTPQLANPLPSTAPAPDVLVRESFGPGPDNLRPVGGKGDLRSSAIHTTIGNFWVEYPGSKGSAWLTPDGNQTWKFAAVGGFLDPYELPSPLQTLTQGAAISDWFDAITAYPSALLPFTPPASAWSVSIEGYPSPLPGSYLALGLSGSAATTSNLVNGGLTWLSLKPTGAADFSLAYELRLNGSTGAVLAKGVTPDLTWNQLQLRYDPATSLLSASVNGVALGSFAVALAPKYLAFEGVGLVDNFVVRKAP